MSDFIKFNQFCHRQVRKHVLSLAKRDTNIGKMSTFRLGTEYESNFDSILAAIGQAIHVRRYDVEENDVDDSINEIVVNSKTGEVSSSRRMPLFLVFPSQGHAIYVHLINEYWGFITARDEKEAMDFLKSLQNVANQSEVQNSNQGPSINT